MADQSPAYPRRSVTASRSIPNQIDRHRYRLAFGLSDPFRLSTCEARRREADIHFLSGPQPTACRSVQAAKRRPARTCLHRISHVSSRFLYSQTSLVLLCSRANTKMRLASRCKCGQESDLSPRVVTMQKRLRYSKMSIEVRRVGNRDASTVKTPTVWRSFDSQTSESTGLRRCSLRCALGRKEIALGPLAVFRCL